MASTVLALTATARPARTVIARLSVVVRHREIVHRTAIVPSLMTAVPLRTTVVLRIVSSVRRHLPKRLIPSSRM
ncbi:MAG: hypothetical protein NTV35_07805, partial [Chloroflexi bacterium]|nr:hypothetical protein [Chloroflexota bacterium]